jgi:hypothetical protein
MRELSAEELALAEKHVQEMQQRNAQYERDGICPSCRGNRNMRVTRFLGGTLESRVTSMEPCYRCSGSGASIKPSAKTEEV